MFIRKWLVAFIVMCILAGCSGQVLPEFSATSVATPSLDLETPSSIPSTATTSPTPTPEVSIESGEYFLFIGDYDQALKAFQEAYDNSAEPEIRAAALWGLGRVRFIFNNPGSALTTLWELTSQYPASINANRAYYLLGEIYSALGRHEEAAQAYTVYLALKPGIIDAHTQEKRGDAYFAAGKDEDAILAYQAALTASEVADNSSLSLKIAQAVLRSGDTSTALTLYDQISTQTSNDYVKAQMDFLAGQVYSSLGQNDLANQRFLHAVENYPLAYDSYSALVALVNAGIPVDDMDRGLVDYFAGQYGLASDAFQRVILSNPENDGTPVYYRALSLFAMGFYESAVDQWWFFVQNYPSNPHWASAWNGDLSLPGLAFTQWYFLGRHEDAVQTLLEFTQTAPSDANSPLYLMEAARILERAGDLNSAAAIWEQVANDYPYSDLAPQALFWSGIVKFRQGAFSDALVAFQRDSLFSSTTEDQARSRFWIGKTYQALGDNSSAQIAWQQAATIDSTDYYSLRAQDMLLSRPAFQRSLQTLPAIDLETEAREAEAWLRVTFSLPPETDLSTIDAVSGNPHFIQGTEYHRLGLDILAIEEFSALRLEFEENPADSYRLGNYLLSLNLYYPAIFTFRQILSLAGMTSQLQTMAAPVYFNHIRYGLYFKDLILSASSQFDLDPLFLISIMRQESLFNKDAESPYAIGLMQITPDTGSILSANLGWPPNYSTSDLKRPLVSTTLGASYLQSLKLQFEGDFYSVLASYNAGPQTAPIWRDLSGPDSDLFVETIRYEETRTYIRSIYEIYSMYQRLFGLGDD